MEKFPFMQIVDIDRTKKASERFRFFPTFLALILQPRNHHGAFDVVMWTEHNGNGWKTKVKKNKVRAWSMRCWGFAHFQWVACGDIDLFIHEKYDEASPAWMYSDGKRETVGLELCACGTRENAKTIFQSSFSSSDAVARFSPIFGKFASSVHCELFTLIRKKKFLQNRNQALAVSVPN